MGKEIDKEALFFLQYKSCGSSSRGIQSGGIILKVEDLYDENYVRQLLKGRWSLMYQVGREVLHSVKSMSLQEFEKIFGIGNTKIRYLLDFDENIESPFRKEVTDVYGKAAFETKPHMTTRYKSGDVIRCSDGYKYLYYGHVENMEIYMNKHLVEEFSGHLYMQLKEKENTLNSVLARLEILARMPSKSNHFILKTKKKAEADTIKNSGLKLKGETEFDVTLKSDYYHREERKAHIKMTIGD